jgi:predicted dehydrogenase
MRGALVGCGYVSQFHLRAWQKVPGIRIEALCDLDGGRAAARAAEFCVPCTYDDVSRMLDEVHPHFLDVATRPDSHLPIIREAAARGVHVLCQKPLAPSLGQLEEMIRLTERASVRLGVNENWRWRPWHREMRKLIAWGVIGRPYFLRFTVRPSKPLAGDAFERQPYFAEMPRLIIYELGVHLIDTARSYLGEVTGLFARTWRVSPVLAGEDVALLLLEFAGRGLALLDLNWAAVSPGRDQRREGYPFRIEGDRGALELGPGAAIHLTREGEPTRALAYELPQDPYVDSYRACQAAFIECLHTGEPFATGGRETYNTMAAVFAAYESAESGQSVAVSAVPATGGGTGAPGPRAPSKGRCGAEYLRKARRSCSSDEPGCTRR